MQADVVGVGAVRFSLGRTTTPAKIETVLEALGQLKLGHRSSL
jgi:hypothetical protein